MLFERKLNARVSVPYLYNDPSTPELTDNVFLPDEAPLRFLVKGYARQAVGDDPILKQAAGCYVTIGNYINYFNKIIAKAPKTVNRWAAVSTLNIFPRAGRMLNAYYDRASLKFFFDVRGDRMFYTADSADVVSHELGHAILDSIRPDLWSVQATEIWSFHEAFADISSMLSILGYSRIVDLVANGDIKKNNVVADIAESFGLFADNRPYLRSAINDFVYVNPLTLPKDAPDNKLSSEFHSFSRVFTAAWYDILSGIYLREQDGRTKVEALELARDIAAEYIYISSLKAPRTINFYLSVAQTMLALDKVRGGTYQRILLNAFQKRKIIQPQIKFLSVGEEAVALKNKRAVIEYKNTKLYSQSSSETIRLSDYVLTSLSVNNLDLTRAELEVPSDIYFYQNDNDVYHCTPNHQDIVDNALLCINTIKDREEIGPDSNTMWEIKGKKLKRTFIV